MNTGEIIIVTAAIVAGTVASILGSLTPELSGLLGAAVGYSAKGISNALPSLPSKQSEDWKPGP